MTQLGLSTSLSQNTRESGPLDYRGQSDTSTDTNPVILAGWSLDFFWSVVPGDVRHGEDVHGHFDDGDQ